MQVPRNWEGGKGGRGEPVTDSHCAGGAGLLASMINVVVEWRVGLPDRSWFCQSPAKLPKPEA